MESPKAEAQTWDPQFFLTVLITKPGADTRQCKCSKSLLYEELTNILAITVIWSSLIYPCIKYSNFIGSVFFPGCSKQQVSFRYLTTFSGFKPRYRFLSSSKDPGSTIDATKVSAPTVASTTDIGEQLKNDVSSTAASAATVKCDYIFILL